MSEPLAKLQSTAPGVHTAADYLSFAQPRLTAETWHYLEGGSGSGMAMQANRHALDAARIITRPLADVRGGSTKLKLFGQQFEHPLLLAPIAYQRLFHHQGEAASAMAANAQCGQMVVSSLASQRLESIIEAAGQALWFQLYWQGDRQRTLQLAKRAIAAGYGAILFTVDAPVKQAVMQLPEDVSAVNLEQPVLPLPALHAGQSSVFDGWMVQAPDWDDLAWLRDEISLPLLVKGVLHADDAEKIINAGCDGLVVSNHGGRVLDGVPGSLEMLPKIVQRVSAKATILFDSGIRNGQDAFKALALGADAVMIGRPYIWGLAASGALGVAHVIRLMRDELEMTMALAGTKDLPAIRAGKCIFK